MNMMLEGLRVPPILGPFLRCGLLLTLGFLQVTDAQEPSSKPDVPTPKAIQTPYPLPKRSPVQEPEPPSVKAAPPPETVEDLPALAASIAARTVAADCMPKICAVLVTDFLLPDGNTSLYGMRLADTLSHQLTSKDFNLGVIDRNLLHNFLTKERVFAESDHRAVINWICDELGARFVVFGRTVKVDGGVVRLSSQLVDTESKEWKIYSAIVNLDPLKSGESLEPIDPFGRGPEITTSLNGQSIEHAGVNGVTMPNCDHIPAPPYPDGARKLKLSGTVTAEAVINSDGKLENIRIVRGMPGGANASVIASMRTWQCHPALKDGKPVPVIVPFVTAFKLY
jgi:TonB family protein